MSKRFISSGTHIGSGYRNWDRVAVSVTDHSLLAVLADGVGGQIHGGTAAGMAVEKFARLHSGDKLEPGMIASVFKQLSAEMRDVNTEMATTIVLVFIVKKGKGMDMFYTWAGDSRLFVLTPENRRFRTGTRVQKRERGNLYILTDDDTVPWRYFKQGELMLNQVTSSEGRNRLFCSLPRNGGSMGDRIMKTRIDDGDKLLLCSDGFWERFSDQSGIISWMRSDLRKVAPAFIKFMDSEVKGRAKVDNASFIRIDLNKKIFKP